MKTKDRAEKREGKEALFTSMPVMRAIASLAVPTVISQLITVIYNMADTFFVGQLGDPNQVAAATVAMPLFMFLTALSNLFGIGGASLISRSLGRGDRERAADCAAFCIWGAGLLALVYGLCVVLFSDALLPILGANDATWDYTKQYLFWTIGVGAMATVLNPALAHLIRAEGYSRQASFGVAFGGLLNIALDPLFIFVFKLQIMGAAVATMLSNVFALVYFICFLCKIRKGSTINASPRRLARAGSLAGEVLSVGLPSFLISTLATVSNTVLNHIIARFSNEAVAGMGIAKKIDLMAFAIAQGMTQGTLPLIGYNYTSGNHKRMLSAIRGLFFSCLAVSLAGMALLLLGADTVTRFFINDAETVRYGSAFLRIICLACPTTSLNFFAITVFQATGKKVQPIILSMLRKGTLDVAFMFLLNSIGDIVGVAWATPISDTLALIVSCILVVPYLVRLKNGAEKGEVRS